jgi:hypothetical protein
MPEHGPTHRLRGFLRRMMMFLTVDVAYHNPILLGHILLRQSAWQWPPLFDRPWAHGHPPQSRIVWDSAGTNFSGTFLSSLANTVGRYLNGLERLCVRGVWGAARLYMWGLGQGNAIFFLLTCVAVALEHGSEVTGRVGGLWGRG